MSVSRLHEGHATGRSVYPAGAREDGQRGMSALRNGRLPDPLQTEKRDRQECLSYQKKASGQSGRLAKMWVCTVNAQRETDRNVCPAEEANTREPS